MMNLIPDNKPDKPDILKKNQRILKIENDADNTNITYLISVDSAFTANSFLKAFDDEMFIFPVIGCGGVL